MVDIGGVGQGLLINWNMNLEELIAGKGIDIINFFIGFSALVAVVILIVAGYLFITSSGDQEKVAKAQKAITGAIIGLIIVFLARAIVFFVVDMGSGGGGGGGGGGGCINIAGETCGAEGFCQESCGAWFICDGGSWRYATSTELATCPI